MTIQTSCERTEGRFTSRRYNRVGAGGSFRQSSTHAIGCNRQCEAVRASSPHLHPTIGKETQIRLRVISTELAKDAAIPKRRSGSGSYLQSWRRTRRSRGPVTLHCRSSGRRWRPAWGRGQDASPQAGGLGAPPIRRGSSESQSSRLMMRMPSMSVMGNLSYVITVLG